MALTPEDVVNKRFQPTKFREGYDQDEVDDFLDEVVVELRRLNQENEELRQRLIAGDARIAELQRTSSQPAPTAQGFEQPVAASAPAPTAVVPASFQPAAVAQTDPNLDPGNTNNLLQLARRLHEEHVREGVEKRDALIAEGQTQAQQAVEAAQAQAQQALEAAQTQAQQAIESGTQQAQRVLEEGKTQAAAVVEQAHSQSRETVAQLEAERDALEARVEELRNFERDYRAKLKGYIEGQLRELETTSNAPAPAAVESSSPPALVGAGAPASAPEAGYPQQSPPASYPGFAGN